jgi:hypothetical protein
MIASSFRHHARAGRSAHLQVFVNPWISGIAGSQS